MPQAVDYDKLASQHGGTPVDYDAIAAQVQAEAAPPQKSFTDQVWDQIKQYPGYQVNAGMLAGLVSSGVHGGDYIRRKLGMQPIIDRPEVQAAMTPPPTFAGNLGYYTEQGLEFYNPTKGAAGLVGQAPATAGRLARMARGTARLAAEGAAAAGVTGIQTGGDETSMAVAGVAPAALAPIAAGARGLGRVASRVAHGASEGGMGGAVASVTRAAIPMTAEDAAMASFKPAGAKLKFKESLQRALPWVKTIEDEGGKAIESVGEFIDAGKQARQRVWAGVTQRLGLAGERGAMVDGNQVADAMVKSIPKTLWQEAPDAAQEIVRRADTYRKLYPIERAEDFLEEANASLEGYYRKFPAARHADAAAKPEVAKELAQADAWRKGINTVLDTTGDGEAVRELKRTYGALRDVIDAAQRKFVKSQMPRDDLAERIAESTAAADRLAGAYRIGRSLFPPNPAEIVRGATDMVRGEARREAARYLAEQRTPNALITRAMAAQQGRAVAPPLAPRVRIAGELPAATIRLGGAPDPSRVRAIPGEYAIPERQGVIVEEPGPPPPAPLALPEHVTTIAPRPDEWRYPAGSEPVPPGHVRLYRGGARYDPKYVPPKAGNVPQYPGQWFTPNPGKARSYGGELHYVDVPQEVAEATSLLAGQQNVLPPVWAEKARPVARPAPMPGAPTTRPGEPRRLEMFTESGAAALRPPKQQRWIVVESGGAKDLFQQAFADAKKQGYTGSPSMLRKRFDQEVKHARAWQESANEYLTDQGIDKPGQLTALVRKMGGINMAIESKIHGRAGGQGLIGELRDLRETTHMGQRRAGAGGVVNFKSGLSADEMASNISRDNPQYRHLSDPGDLIAALKADVLNRRTASDATVLAQALEANGVRPGTKWWEEDISFNPAELEPVIAQAQTALATIRRHGFDIEAYHPGRGWMVSESSVSDAGRSVGRASKRKVPPEVQRALKVFNQVDEDTGARLLNEP